MSYKNTGIGKYIYLASSSNKRISNKNLKKLKNLLYHGGIIMINFLFNNIIKKVNKELKLRKIYKELKNMTNMEKMDLKCLMGKMKKIELF